MGTQECNALNAAGARCHAPVGEGADRCPVGHIPVLAHEGQTGSDVEGACIAEQNGLADEEQPSGGDAKYDFELWGDWTSVGQAVVLAPLLVISAFCLMFSLLPVFLVLWNVVPGHWLIPVAVYYAVGLLFFFAPIENFMWKYLDRSSREPTHEERQRLIPAWEDVVSRVGKGGERQYRLRVVASTQLNAYAGGGRQVAITQGALEHLSDSELRGIVAHELGHHAGLHPVVGLAAHWIIKPIVWAEWVSVKLHNLSVFFTRFARSSLVFWVVYILSILLLIAVCILRGVVHLTRITLLWFGRRAEYLADETAVLLGFGPGLLDSLYAFQELEQQEGLFVHDSRLEEMLSNTHPPRPQTDSPRRSVARGPVANS